MKRYDLGNPEASHVLVQMVDGHDLSVMEGEVAKLSELAGEDFALIAWQVDSWNEDLSPWKAPAVFGREGFGEGARRTLETVLQELKKSLAEEQREGGKRNRPRKVYLGGYSLAGLFALWAAYETDVFDGVAAASPSVWFPGFLDFMKEKDIQTKKVYLSLGDREEKTRNPVMASVGDCIREGHGWLSEKGVPCTLEWNPGNHFKEPEVRMAKGFAWLMGEE